MGAARGSKPFHEGRLGNTDPEAPWRACVIFTSYNLGTDNAAPLFLLLLIGFVNSAASSPVIFAYTEAIHPAVSSPSRTLAGPIHPNPAFRATNPAWSPKHQNAREPKCFALAWMPDRALAQKVDVASGSF